MKITKEIPITQEILKESLMMMKLNGERSLIEVNNLQPSDDFIVNHMKQLGICAGIIREKLDIGDYQIAIDQDTCCIVVFDTKVKDLNYETNYMLKKDAV